MHILVYKLVLWANCCGGKLVDTSTKAHRDALLCFHLSEKHGNTYYIWLCVYFEEHFTWSMKCALHQEISLLWWAGMNKESTWSVFGSVGWFLIFLEYAWILLYSLKTEGGSSEPSLPRCCSFVAITGVLAFMQFNNPKSAGWGGESSRPLPSPLGCYFFNLNSTFFILCARMFASPPYSLSTTLRSPLNQIKRLEKHSSMIK